MSLVRIGNDIIEIKRIKNLIQKDPKYIQKILSDAEITLYESYQSPRRDEFLAGRFCAKEAYGKALYTGVGTQLKLNAIEIMPNEHGAPTIRKGPVLDGVQIAISHSNDYATAVVLIDQTDAQLAQQLTAYFLGNTAQ